MITSFWKKTDKKDNLLGFIANKKFMHKKTKLNFLLKKI